MREAGRQRMDDVLTQFGAEHAKHVNVLDVGSYDVNGNFRDLVEGRGWTYTGLDIVTGPNVDIVAKDAYSYPVPGVYDAVISGYTMEHVPAIWVWIPYLTTLLRKGGLLAIVTHTHYNFHPHPVDCWRIMPDGMRYLFDCTGELECYRVEMFGNGDILGAARKC